MKWNRRAFGSAGVTEFPPGPNLARLDNRKIYVTTPGFDNIGEILISMNVKFEAFDGSYDCALLFINCGTPDQIVPAALADFVSNGGCVYASDHVDATIASAFPQLLSFGGHQGNSGPVKTSVVDPELRELIGRELTIDFDMGSWATILPGKGEVILESRASGVDRPLMVYAEYGKGAVFFTSFHNKAQTSAEEKRLLQLLVLKQLSVSAHSTLKQTGDSLGISVRL
ncbi:hypothetical protein [Rhodococcus sp. 1168]|uniref:hypothetical protein n=1 Tax=Rhodococcus sp. 1168 TaxID=2018041 RepID=UPI000F736B48|nr:hypothetical protein [Rhodococcus sp. 1168]